METLRAEAAQLAREADTREKLGDAIRAYESAVALDPDDPETLTDLCAAYCLKGAAHSRNKAEKRRAYKSSIQYCERALYTNPEFKALIDDGAPFREACGALTKDDMEALFLWANAVSYYFKECLWPPAVIFNIAWMRNTFGAMERMREIDPEWRQGSVDFFWAVYYLGLPEKRGGDMAESLRLFDKAIQAGPEMLVFRWGRAKYWAVKAGDRDLFETDLAWVLEQDPRQTENPPYSWNVYFQRDAADMLAHADDLF